MNTRKIFHSQNKTFYVSKDHAEVSANKIKQNIYLLGKWRQRLDYAATRDAQSS